MRYLCLALAISLLGGCAFYRPVDCGTGDAFMRENQTLDPVCICQEGRRVTALQAGFTDPMFQFERWSRVKAQCEQAVHGRQLDDDGELDERVQAFQESVRRTLAESRDRFEKENAYPFGHDPKPGAVPQ